ncbi:MAG TPA: ABATE domain-containing protein [Ktedonobacteraceae bacterium]|nr:ABATE domain-containing protein [Ktedonobacteraceae bacterium]
MGEAQQTQQTQQTHNEHIPLSIPDFDSIPGNWLCLDFTHTLENRFSAPEELLNSYDDVVAWGIFSHLLTEDEAERLLQKAKSRPGEACAALVRAVDVREALYRIFYAISQGDEPHEHDMAVLNSELARAMSHASLVLRGDGYAWDWSASQPELDVVLWHVVRSAAELLTSNKLSDVRACAADDCRWLFLDISKNHSRRWCDMQTCGNQAKARRHYSRKKVTK